MINLPKSAKDYRNLSKLRAYKNRNRRNNYRKGWIDSHNRIWTEEENFKVLDSNKLDRELSKEINRSVSAIQTQRARLNKVKAEYKVNNF